MSDRRGVVWILGSGFSKYLGAPTLAELLTKGSAEDMAQAFKLTGQEAEPLMRVVDVYAGGQEKKSWADAEAFIDRLDNARRNESAAAIMQRHARAGSHAEAMRAVGRSIGPVDDIEELHRDALWVLAMETSAFLLDADKSMERWEPYRAWAEALRNNDTVLTFNYDAVPDILGHGLEVVIPTRRYSKMEFTPVIKLHGSTRWRLRNGVIETIDFDPKDRRDTALIATPGPTKRRMTTDEPFKILWDFGARSIANAEALVFVGYRMPPTDAGTKQWLVDAVRQWASTNENNQSPMFVHIVLGPTPGADATRLVGLLKSIEPRLTTVTWPLGAEDFLGLFRSSELLRTREKIPSFAAVV